MYLSGSGSQQANEYEREREKERGAKSTFCGHIGENTRACVRACVRTWKLNVGRRRLLEKRGTVRQSASLQRFLSISRLLLASPSFILSLFLLLRLCISRSFYLSSYLRTQLPSYLPPRQQCRITFARVETRFSVSFSCSASCNARPEWRV